MSNQKRVYELSTEEVELVRWIVVQGLECMIDNLVDGEDDDDRSLECMIDALIENWQEYADEELEELHKGLAAFVLVGSGRFSYKYDEAKDEAIRAAFMKYFIG